MRRALVLAPLLALGALLLPVEAHAAAVTVSDPVGDGPRGHDITSVRYTTDGGGVGMSVTVPHLAPTGRVRLTVSPLTDQAFQYDVIRYRGRVYDACYRVDYSRTGKAERVSCAGLVDHFSYDLKKDRVAIVVKDGVQYDESYAPYKLQAFAVRASGTAFDTARSRTLAP